MAHVLLHIAWERHGAGRCRVQQPAAQGFLAYLLPKMQLRLQQLEVPVAVGRLDRLLVVVVLLLLGRMAWPVVAAAAAAGLLGLAASARIQEASVL